MRIRNRLMLSTCKYVFKVNGETVLRGFTIDLKRREQEHRPRWPNGRIEQVGHPTTHEDAWNWARQQSEPLSDTAA